VAEFGLAAWWWLGSDRTQALRWMAGLLLVITLALLFQWVVLPPPNCSCFGDWIRFETKKSAWAWHFGLNVTLLLGAGLGIALLRFDAREERGEKAGTPSDD